jgi:hypothetical protein
MSKRKQPELTPAEQYKRLNEAAKEDGVTKSEEEFERVFKKVAPQKRAVRNYRSRLRKRGLARFEVLGRHSDRDLIRSLARRLAEDGAEASRLRDIVSRSVAGMPHKRGGILVALRRSPLVGADLDLRRPHDEGRKVEI